MKITRLSTDKDQKSNFADIELVHKILTTHSRPATMRFSAVFRPAPRRQYLVTMSGLWEIEASNGVKRVFKAGDVMLADDTTVRDTVRASSAMKPHTS